MPINKFGSINERKPAGLRIKTQQSFAYMPKQSINDIVATPKLEKSGHPIISAHNSFDDDSSSDEFHRRILFDTTSIIGRRDTNEDTHIQFTFGNLHIAALFDGHNGDQVSKMCQLSLEKYFTDAMSKHGQNNMKQVLQDTINAMNDVVIQSHKFNMSGCTSLIVVIDRDQKLAYVSNVGDSRLLIGYHDHFEQTRDHTPYNDRERIEKAGGKVECVEGVLRVNGCLGVARSIGDEYLKKYVICQQDYYEFDVSDANYILMACDGLYEAFTSEDVHEILMQIHKNKITNTRIKNEMQGRMDVNCQVTSHAIKQNSIYGQQSQMHQKKLFENVALNKPLAKRATQLLSKLAYMEGSQDNVSVMLMFLNCQNTTNE